MRLARGLIVFCALLMLVACDLPPDTEHPTPVPATATPSPVTRHPSPVTPPILLGRFRVELTYQRQAAYARTVLGSDEDSRWNPYFRQVVEPLADYFAGYPQPAPIEAHWAADGAAIEPQSLIDLGRMADAANVPGIITATLPALDGALPGGPTSIYVFAGLPTLADGAGGAGPGAGRITLIVNTDTLDDSAHAVDEWRRWLPYHLYRELYAAARGDKLGLKPGSPETLLDLSIRYGLADLFARTAYPDLKPPWLTALTPAQEHSIWGLMQPLLGSSDQAELGRFAGGSVGGDIPSFSAFTIGFHIVSAYSAAHPGSTPADLLATPSADILSGSSYKP